MKKSISFPLDPRLTNCRAVFGSVSNSVLKSLRLHLFGEVAGGYGHYRQQNKAACQP